MEQPIDSNSLESSGGSSAPSSSPGQNQPDSAAMKYPEFEEGGTLDFGVDDAPLTVTFDYFRYLNTGHGCPDVIEIGEFEGTGTYLAFTPEDKLKNGADGLSDYFPLVGKPVSLQPDAGTDPPAIRLPDSEICSVLGGSLTMQKFTHGMDGHDWWEGTIELVVSLGPANKSMSAMFRGGIIPTW